MLRHSLGQPLRSDFVQSLFGISFQADSIQLRVDYAKELITGTDFPLEQIAYACGYGSEVHFYRQFQQKTGMTPGDYRKIYCSSPEGL